MTAPGVATSAVARARAERWRLLLTRTRGFGRRYAGRTDGVIGLAILILFAALALAPELSVAQTSFPALTPAIARIRCSTQGRTLRFRVPHNQQCVPVNRVSSYSMYCFARVVNAAT